MIIFSIFRQFATLTFQTAKEIIRQPVILLVTTVFLVLIGLLPYVILLDFGEDGKLVRDGALAFHLVFGILLAAMAASLTLYREIRSGTASMVLAKPVHRATFFLAKYCGIALVLLLVSIMAMIMALLSVRVSLYYREPVFSWFAAPYFPALLIAYFLAGAANFFLKRPFISQAFIFSFLALLSALLLAVWIDPGGHLRPAHLFLQWKIINASLLISMALLVMAALAISLSTRLSALFTLSVCGIVFMLGLLSDYLFGGFGQNPFLAVLCFGVLPDWSGFWMVDALSSGTIPWNYVLGAACYAGLCALGILCLGLISFRDAEIG